MDREQLLRFQLSEYCVKIHLDLVELHEMCRKVEQGGPPILSRIYKQRQMKQCEYQREMAVICNELLTLLPK